MLIGDPAVPSILMGIVGIAFGTLLGSEVLVGPPTLLHVADLIFIHGTWALTASIGWAGGGITRFDDLGGTSEIT